MVRTGKPLTMNRRDPHEPSRESFERSPAGMQERAAKESVAAHQATCSCHVMLFKALASVDDMVACCDRRDSGGARDRDGNRWHIDPLCKVRPEAKG